MKFYIETNHFGVTDSGILYQKFGQGDGEGNRETVRIGSIYDVDGQISSELYDDYQWCRQEWEDETGEDGHDWMGESDV